MWRCLIFRTIINLYLDDLFWCLDEHVEKYKTLFRDYATITVLSIEAYLKKSRDDFFASRANRVIEMMQELLKPGRNTIRDKVTIKVIFSFFILAERGDYIADSNVAPMKDQPVNLGDYKYIHIPHFFHPTTKVETIDAWLIYSPPNQNQQAIKLFDTYYKRWLDTEQIYHEQGGYTQKYHDEIGNSIDASLKGINPLKYWPSNPTIHLDQVSIPELGIVKSYFNTHKFEMRSEYESQETLMRSKFTLFLSNTDAENLNNPIRNIIFGYLYEPEESKSNTLFELESRGKRITEIFLAVHKGDTEKLQELIDHGEDVNKLFNDVTPLHYAVETGQVDCVRILLDCERTRLDLTFFSSYDQKDLTAYELAQLIDNKKITLLFEERFKQEKSSAPTKKS